MVSGWVVLFHRDGRSVEPACFANLMAALAHRGADGCDVVIDGSVGLGHQHFWTTSEENGERQPIHSSEADVDLVFDGRLDNRESLLAELAIESPLARPLSDAAVALRAFGRWRDDCFSHFEGPFAMAFFDRVRRSLLCARDALGERTLVYYSSPTLVIVASEEAAVLSHPQVSQRTDRESVARHFALLGPNPGATYFEDLRELPPAHVLHIRATGESCRRYWDLDPGHQIRYRDDRDYADHFLALLRDSVESHLRTSSSSPAVLMSGGLDSTSVAAIAGRSACESGRAPVCAVSWIFDDLPECDERQWQTAVVEAAALEPIWLRGDDSWPLADGEASWPSSPNVPFSNPFRLLLDRAYRAVADRGGRVVLSGWFGDHLYLGQEQWLADLLTERRWWSAVREALRALRLRGEAIRLGLRPGLRYLGGTVPGADRLRRWRSGPPRASWLTDEAREIALDTDPDRDGGSGRELRRRWMLNSLDVVSAREESSFASRALVEVRYPYWTRRMMEFALGIPSHLLYRPGSEKHVLRMAMAGLLPEAVRLRQGHRVLDSLFLRLVSKSGLQTVKQLLESPGAGWHCFVDRRYLEPILEGGWQGGRMGIEAAVLWQCLSFEIWRRRGRLTTPPLSL